MTQPCTCTGKHPCPACTAYTEAQRPAGRPGRPLGASVSRLAAHHAALVTAYHAGARLTTLAAQYGVSPDMVGWYLRKYSPVKEDRRGSNGFVLRRKAACS